LIYSGITDVSIRTGRVAFAGGGDLPSNGAGSLVLTGFARIDANDGAPIEAVLNLAPSGAATFDLNGFNQTFALLRKNNANTGVLTNTSLTASVLTLDTPAFVAAPLLVAQTEGFGGTVSGNLSVIKSGAGTQTFTTGSVASFTGGLTVNSGVLELQGAVSYAGATLISGGVLRTSTAQTGTSSIGIGSTGRLVVRIANPGGALATGGLTTSAGSRIDFDLGAFGNPTLAPINAPALITGTDTLLTIVGAPATGVFPLIAYDNINPIGGAGFAGFKLGLPLRVAGSLVDNSAAGTVDVNIAGVDNPKWRGDISTACDINDGSGSGTLNWRGILSDSPTQYFQNAPATDHVLFDDSATSGSVSLTATLTPLSVTVNNPVRAYTFSGPGRISGATSIVKSGAGTLVLANAGSNDFTGGIVINGGRVEIGDGINVGTGTLGTGAITNNGTLVFNRPGDFAFANTISGAGALDKRQSGTMTIPAAATLAVPVAASEGTIAFAAGATLTGTISGAGAIQFGAASQIGGTDANTFTGAISISAGDLQLNKPAGINATGNVINITGTGRLLRLAADQIPDTATINFTGTSTDSLATQTGAETLENIIVNSANAGATGGQVIMRNDLIVRGVGTVSRGILGVASGSTATVNAVNITALDTTSAILRIAGGGAASSLNIGPGGITASGGDIQVKFSTTNQDAIINLGGDFTSTGNVIFTNAGYTGVNLNVINLLGDRTFNIGAGTLTTVAPDFGGSGGLIKAGDGTLTLNASSAAGHTGGTTVSAGILEVNGSITGSVALNGGTLAGIGSIGSAPAIFDFNTGAKISPGPSGGIGTMTFGASTVDFADGATPIASASLLFDIGDPLLSDRISLPSGALNIGSGVLEFDDFVFTPQAGFADQLVYTLVETSQPIAGSFGAGRFGTVGGFPAQIAFGDGGTDIVLIIPEPGSAALLLGGLALLAARGRRS
jgi:autotransporter-associated beta strand protein